MKYESISATWADVVKSPETHCDSWYALYGKRVFDVAFAVLLLPVFVPVIAVLWGICRRDGGPGLYGHTRVGHGGASFKCWKIRSMVPDADVRLARLLDSDPQARAEWDRDQKLSNDPRVTRFGTFIRRTSLDEFPQIFNVLKGDMSFVGPRPVVAEELQRYGRRKDAYLSMKPGVTGMWQVFGRNYVSYSKRVALDVEYQESRSFAMDIYLILCTARTVVLGTGT